MIDYASRIDRLSERMVAGGVDAALIGLGPDLEYLTGYRAHQLERLTMLVVRPGEVATMVLPVLEAAHFHPVDNRVVARPWIEVEDPITLVAQLLGEARVVAVSDETWARFVIDLQQAVPGLRLQRAAGLTGPLRLRKDSAEVELLRLVGACVDEVLSAVQAGSVPLVGRSERDVARDITARLLDAGHETVEFCIIGSGPNAASPHHEPTDRIIQSDEIVLFDIGGRRAGYSSDSTRCVVTGSPAPQVMEAYAVLQAAQRAGVEAARAGNTCEAVDAATRKIIVGAGWGERFIHRTGHGIGLAAHEEPYIVEGNTLPLEPGFAFSVEPGIYVPERWGLRIEDIVVVTDSEPIRCNTTTTDLVAV